MNQSNIIPFIKNRYYKGKLLTSRDFEAEQQYIANKTRFMNQLMAGKGVLTGLSVSAMDDKTLLVESGAAIDAIGRELVLAKNNVVKLSALEGFTALDGEVVDICIKYSEKQTEPVYVAGTEQESENNRIEEGCQLYVRDHVDALVAPKSRYMRSMVLFEDENYRVQIQMPDIVSNGYYVNLELLVEGKNDFGKLLCFEAKLSSPALRNSQGETELAILVEDLKVANGQCKVIPYRMEVADKGAGETTLIPTSGSMKAFVDGEEKEVSHRASLGFSVSGEKPYQLALLATSAESLEEKLSGETDVVLATVTLSMSAATYMIESVDESIKEYVPLPSSQKERAKFESYFSKKSECVIKESDSNEKKEEVLTDPFGRKIATGLLEIPLGNGGREGKTYYSGEIMHGLGTGNVYVEIGLDSIYEDASGKSGQATIFGDADVFSEKKSGILAKSGVMVHNDKGSFVAGVKLLEDVNLLVLTYRWVAISLDSDAGAGYLDAFDNQSISAVTPTIVLKTKESHFFQAQFHNMKPCSLSYELTEPGCGEISADGIFTAPSKEGVYEIKIYCSEKPFICTYAYAIVKKTV